MFGVTANALRRFLTAAVFAAVGGLAITLANTPAHAQYYPPVDPPGYAGQYYSNPPYQNAYEARRAFWIWRHQYWRWYHQYYR